MVQISILALAAALLTACVSGALAQTPIASCRTLDVDGGSYVLTSDVSSAGTCMTIRGDGITLDLDGHTINFDTAAQGRSRGVLVSGTDGVIVRNGTILQHSGCRGDGLCARDAAVRVSASFDTLVEGLDITVQGYDSFGIYASGASSSCRPSAVLRVDDNTITHNGTHLSSRDGFSSEPIKIDRQASRFEITNNRILASPQAGIMVYGYGDEGDGCNDGSEIAYNTIDIDGAFYANPGGIHGYHTPALEIHHNRITGEGQEGIQLDGARYQKDGAVTRIYENTIDVDCNYWPRGHTSGPGVLQGLRLRYTTEYVDVYDNTIRVHADAVDDELERNSATGIHLTCARWNGSARTGGCKAVRIFSNTVEARTTGLLEPAHAITLDGIEDELSSGVEIYDNVFRSNGTILRYFDQGTIDDSTVFHDNVLEYLPGERYRPATVRVDWSNSQAWGMSPSALDTRFAGDATSTDVALTGGGVPDKSFSWDWLLAVHVTDRNGADVEEVDVRARDRDGNPSGSCTTDCSGRCELVLREITYLVGRSVEHNPHRITAAKAGDESTELFSVNGPSQSVALVLENTDDPSQCAGLDAPENLCRTDVW